MNNINKLIEEFAEAKKKFQETAEGLFKVEVKEFFDKVPEITVIKWGQKIPYFNDGDPCYFYVEDPSFSNAQDPDVVSHWGEYDGDTEGEWVFQGTYDMPDEIKNDPVKSQACKDFSSIICSKEMEDVMQIMFGEHAMVTITRDGINVDEYDHD